MISLRASWTWRELDDASERLAASYLRMGLKAGDRIASLMPNRCELVIHYLACFKSGLVATPLNYRYMAPEIDHALRVSGACVLLAHDERAADIADTELVSGLRYGIISYDDGGGKGDKSFGNFVSAEKDRVVVPPAEGDAPIIIFFTSGSTGKPKGVTHTYDTLGWKLASCAMSYGLSDEDIMMPGSSMSHVGGFWNCNTALAVGAKVAIARSFDAHEILPALRTMQPTVLIMLPSALFALIRDNDAVSGDFASVRLCISGGDKISTALEREYIQKTGHVVGEVYGMSEIGLSNENLLNDMSTMGSVGRTNAGYSLELRDDAGNEVPVGQPGRLWCKFPGITVGYWDNPEATAETIIDGWLDTGDVMIRDENDYFWFQGRKKQIIVHDASNICPQEVEESLLAHSAVEEAGVIGVQDLVHGENVRAYVVLCDGEPYPTQQQLIDFSKKSVGYKAPEEIIFLEEMPMNATGKVDRVTLKAMAAAGQ